MQACPILTTPNLILRKPEIDDAPVIYQLLQDSSIAANIPAIQQPFSIETAHELIAQAHQSLAHERGFHFVIVNKAENCVMGAIGLELRDTLQEARLHFWLGHPYRGSGYMAETIRRIYPFGFDILRMRRLYAVVPAQDGPSMRLLSRVGMVFERIQHGYIVRGNIPINGNIYNIYRNRYEKLR